MSGHEQSWGQNCTEIAPATPHGNGLSALLRLATYATVHDYRAIQGVTVALGAYSDALYAFTSRGFSGEARLVSRNNDMCGRLCDKRME